ncbi:hypothetical protein U9M48_020952 [Paspalum notatum var. saurae]
MYKQLWLPLGGEPDCTKLTNKRDYSRERTRADSLHVVNMHHAVGSFSAAPCSLIISERGSLSISCGEECATRCWVLCSHEFSACPIEPDPGKKRKAFDGEYSLMEATPSGGGKSLRSTWPVQWLLCQCHCLFSRKRSQEQPARRPVASTPRSTVPPQPVESGQSSSGGICHFTLPMQCGVAALLCRPAQSDRGDEQLQCRAPPPPQGPPTTRRRGPMRQRLYGEEARLIVRYSSGPLVGPRPVTAWLAGYKPAPTHRCLAADAERWQ